MSQYKLYSDCNVWHKEYKFKDTLSYILCDNGIKDRARLVAWNYNTKSYRVDNTGFEFDIQTIDNE